MKVIEKNCLKKAIKILKNGGVVVFPTETAYGLAADATNKKAVRRIFSIKGRKKEKTFPLIVANQTMAEHYIILSPVFKKIVKKYWPGPLTVVAPIPKSQTNLLPFGVIRNGTIAVRVSSHPIAQALSRGLGLPIVSTSANFSDQPICYSVRAVKKQFVGQKRQPDFYLDIGRLPKRKPSTIIFEKKGQAIVLRQGTIRL